MKYGLTDSHLEEVTAILKSYPQIDRAIVLGSRATETYSEASDVDIALKGEDVEKILYKVKSSFEESNLPFFFDVVDYHAIDHPPFKEHIDRKGEVFYCKGWRKMKLKDIVKSNCHSIGRNYPHKK